jgi:hypothetical protein
MAETRTKRRVGRPLKTPARGTRRIKLGLVVSAEAKRRLDKAAEASGLSLSQEAERRIEDSFHYERALGSLDAIEARVQEIARANTESALRRAGWATVLDPNYGGDIWLPPGRHNFPEGGWIDPKNPTSPAPLRVIPEPRFAEFIEKLTGAVMSELQKRKKP